MQQQPLIISQQQINDKTSSVNVLEKYLENEKNNQFQSQHLFIKVLLGKFFIQQYRIFKLFPKLSSIILWKKDGNKTKYMFLLIVQNLYQLAPNYQVDNKEIYFTKNSEGIIQSPFMVMKKSIQKFIRRPLEHFVEFKNLLFEEKEDMFREFENIIVSEQRIIFLTNLLAKAQPLQIQKVIKMPQHLQELLNKIKIDNYTLKGSKDKEDIFHEGDKQFDNMKFVISTYIDNFGNQQKAIHLYKQMQKSCVSFSVEILLNTIAFIIYEQLKNSKYSTIQSSYWTYFEQKTRKLIQDRKHLVFTGNGQICILQIIFTKQIDKQKQIQQYINMLAQCKKFYKRAKIILFRLTSKQWDGHIEKIDCQDDQQNDAVRIQKMNQSRNNRMKNSKGNLIYQFDRKVMVDYDIQVETRQRKQQMEF